MSNGTLAAMNSRGAVDVSLTSDPTLTYWILEYETHTPFTTELICSAFQGTPQLGKSARAEFPRAGDAIHRVFLVASMPAIDGLTFGGTNTQGFPYLSTIDVGSGATAAYTIYQYGNHEFPLGGHFAHWINAVGYFMISEIRMNLSAQTICKMSGLYMYIIEELSGGAGTHVDEEVGKYSTREAMIAHSEVAHKLYIPLCFWFNMVSGNALSLAALSLNTASITVDFAALNRLVVLSNDDLVPQSGGANLGNSSITFELLSEFVFLDDDERARFSTSAGYDQLIETVQHSSVAKTDRIFEHQLHFSNPVKEILWVHRLAGNITACDFANFTSCGPLAVANVMLAPSGYNNTGYHLKQPFPAGDLYRPVRADEAIEEQPHLDGDLIDDTSAGMKFSNAYKVRPHLLSTMQPHVNGSQLTGAHDADVWRLVMPRLAGHASKASTFGIYSLPFAIESDAPYPSGSLNHSKVDSVVLKFTMNWLSSISSTKFEEILTDIWARTWNILVINQGSGGLGYNA